jgi:dienelactone hydrolase
MRHVTIVTMVLITACLPAAAQNTSNRHIAARTELHSIPSLTLSDQQFLTGDRNAKPVNLTGQLRIAQGAGKLPLVILMHGSGGLSGNVEAWSARLNAMGISTFAIDGFTARGLTSVSGNQALLGRLNFVLDIYRAMEVLAKHPRVDTSRMALMGFSRGGQAALYASLERFHKQWNTSGTDFQAYIPFYPDCATTFTGDIGIGARKVHIHHGAADDYNPVATCKAYLARLKSAGRDVTLSEYPGVHHAFDNPIGPAKPTPSPASQSVRACTISESDGGTLLNTATNTPFTYKDACVVMGPHTGHDPAATDAAIVSVTGLLRMVFKL